MNEQEVFVAAEKVLGSVVAQIGGDQVGTHHARQLDAQTRIDLA